MRNLIVPVLTLSLVFGVTAVSAENADQGGYSNYSYKNGTLMIPRVDVPGQIGRYQDVVFQFDPQFGAWFLQHVESRDNMPETPIIERLVSAAAVDANDPTVPAQVFISVIGEYTCGRIGQINQRRAGNLFEIQITQDPLQPDEICDQKVRVFSRVIALDVFRLNAGTYQYSINNGIGAGSFTLPFSTASTSFSDECGGSPEDDDTPDACGNNSLPF